MKLKGENYGKFHHLPMPGQGLHIISTFKNLHVTSNSTVGVCSVRSYSSTKHTFETTL